MVLLSVAILDCISEEYVLKNSEEIFGTWENLDYHFGVASQDKMLGAQRVIFHQNGKCEWHNLVYDIE
jgi:hypothetical protein